MPNEDILTVKELAEYLKIAEKTAYRFASEGKVPGDLPPETSLTLM